MNNFRGRVFAILRVLVGLCFLWATYAILSNDDLLFGGLMRQLNQTGGPMRFYRDAVLPILERNETVVVHIVAYTSLCIGLLFISGTLVSLTSLLAAFLVANFGLASSSWNRPRQVVFFLLTILLLMIGRAGAGLTWGVDALLVRRFQDWLVLFPLRRRAPQ